MLLISVPWVGYIEAKKVRRGRIGETIPIALYAFANHLSRESHRSRYTAHLGWTAIYAFRRALAMDEAVFDTRLKCANGLARTVSELANRRGDFSAELLQQFQIHAFAPYQLDDVDVMEEVESALLEAAHKMQTPQLEDEGFRLLRARLSITRSWTGITNEVDNAAIEFLNRAQTTPELLSTSYACNGRHCD